MSRTRAFLENTIIVAIVLVLVQTFLEDLAVLGEWSWLIRRILMFTGFGFDILFSVEFLTRLYFSFVNRRTGVYFWYERGWIDLVASIPLLLLSSGPAVLAYWSGSATIIGFAGILNVLKVVKAIRIARILRLLRVLKIFARIRNTDSTMAQRHVAKISTVAVSVLVTSVLLFTVLFGYLNVPSLESRYQERTVNVLEQVGLIMDLPQGQRTDRLNSYAQSEKLILTVESGSRVVFTALSQKTFETEFGPTDYAFGEIGDTRVFFDMRPVNQEQSRGSLMYFAVIILMVMAFLLYYSPHFALTISDPIHIMRRGMNEKGYNLEVRIPPLYRDDEVYRLGQLYNEVYLPLKDRSNFSDESDVLDLKIDDIKDILNE